MRYNNGEEEEFSLKAYAISNGESSKLWQVTPEKFEHGEFVTDTKTGRHGQVIFTTWDAELEGWRYCIRRKDIDNKASHIPEAQLVRAPAQTRIDNGKTILFAPRRFEHHRVPLPKLNKRDEYWNSKRLVDQVLRTLRKHNDRK